MTRKLDKLVSDITRAKGRCSWCGKTDNLQAAHIFSRTYKSVRWDLDNVVCLCAKCHFEGHKRPIDFVEWIKSYLGEFKYQQLKMKTQSISHHKLHDLVALYDSLNKITQKTS